MRTVVVIEPYQPAREGLVKLLRNEGFRVTEADACDTLPDDALDGPVHALLVDAGFPAGANEVRVLERFAGRTLPPVCFMTCEAWRPARMDAAVLLKPIDPSLLISWLRGR